MPLPEREGSKTIRSADVFHTEQAPRGRGAERMKAGFAFGVLSYLHYFGRCVLMNMPVMIFAFSGVA